MSDAAARKARRAQRRLATSADIQITSMMDMFTIILVFLLTFFDPSRGGADSVELPAVAATGKDAAGLRVEVRKDGVWLDDRRLLPLDGAGGLPRDADLGAVSDALRQHDGAEGLLVAVDKSVPYATVAGVLGAASAAGFDEYRFVVESTR